MRMLRSSSPLPKRMPRIPRVDSYTFSPGISSAVIDFFTRAIQSLLLIPRSAKGLSST